MLAVAMVSAGIQHKELWEVALLLFDLLLNQASKFCLPSGQELMTNLEFEMLRAHMILKMKKNDSFIRQLKLKFEASAISFRRSAGHSCGLQIWAPRCNFFPGAANENKVTLEVDSRYFMWN